MEHQKEKVPNLRFKGFTNDWEERKLGEHAKYRRGSFPQPYGNKEWYDGEGAMPFVQVVDVTNNLTLVENTKQKISKLAQSKSVFVPKGTVVVTLQGSIGRVAITQYDSFVDRTLLIFEDYEKETDERFWAYTIQKKFEIEKLKAPGGTIKTITKEALSLFDVHLPQFKEQAKIGSFFKKIDDTITLQQRKLDLLKQFKKGLLQKMFADKDSKRPVLRFKGFHDDWEQRKVSDIFTVTRGQVLATTKISEVKTNEMCFPVYSSQTKNNGLMGYYNKYLFNTAITWTTDGANAGTVNYREGKFYSTNVNGVLLSDDGYANKAIAEILDRVAWRHVSRVGNPKLMNNVMSNIKISIPSSFEEQNAISEFLIKFDHLIVLHQRKQNHLKLLKKSLLQQMFM